jgi:hypothetical protein
MTSKEAMRVFKTGIAVVEFLFFAYLFLVVHEITHTKIAYYFQVKLIHQDVYRFNLEYDASNLNREEFIQYQTLHSWNELIGTLVLGMMITAFYFVIVKMITEDL